MEIIEFFNSHTLTEDLSAIMLFGILLEYLFSIILIIDMILSIVTGKLSFKMFIYSLYENFMHIFWFIVVTILLFTFKSQ